MLDSLVESLPTARVLLLVNYRPEYSHSWGSKTSYSRSGSTLCAPTARRPCCVPCWATMAASHRSSSALLSRPRGTRSSWKRAHGQ